MAIANGLQVVSDIHLEFRGKHVLYSALLPRTATDLALCGDIGRPFMEVSGAICHYKAFLLYAANTWRHVFVVTGNHCYYGRRKTETDIRIQAYCDERPNLHFLNDSTYTFTPKDNVPFHGIFGSTLWTNVTNEAFACMNDRRIRREPEYMTGYTRTSTCVTADVIREWHKKHTDAIKALHASDTAQDAKWIIMSHHPPRPPPECMKGIMHADAATWSAYINNVSPDIFNANHIAVWLCGHLHSHFDALVDGIRYVCNCMGYPKEKHTAYDPACNISYAI